MTESPRDRMKRQPNRLHSPHSGQSLEPTLTRKGVLAHPGSLAMGFAAIAFFVYVFNLGGVQTMLDGLLNGLNRDARSHNDEVATWFVGILPYIGMALTAALVFFALILLRGILGGGSGSAPSKSKKPKRTGLDEFVTAAAEQGVGERVAREAYSLLAPRYGKAAISLGDSLAKRLGMTPAQVSDMQGTLMRYTDRQIKVGGPDSQSETVLDMLLAVEKSTVRSVTPVKTPEPEQPIRLVPAVAVVEKVEAVSAEVAGATTATFIRPFRPEKASVHPALEIPAR